MAYVHLNKYVLQKKENVHGAKIVDKYDTDILYIKYNLENSFKFKLLVFWQKKTPLLNKNAPLGNVPKKIGRALPPIIWTKSKRKHFFSGESP